MTYDCAAHAPAAGAEKQDAPSCVSVIMIFLNAEEFIEAAIESVFAQTWPHWELLLVDDGSTDRSTAIARGYAERHPERVRDLEHPGHANRGMSVSRNLGIAHARGKYVAFLDADDVYLPERLAKHVAVLEAQPEVDMVQSTMIDWYSWTGDGEEDHALPSIGPLDVVMSPPTMLRVYLSTPLSPGICSVTARSTAVADIDGFEDAFKGFCEDRVFLAKMYATKNVFVIDEALVRYRRHPESLTLRVGDRTGEAHVERFRARKAYFLWLRSFLHSRSIDDPSLDAAIERQLRLEDQQNHRASTEGLPLNRVPKVALTHLARLVLPNSLCVRRRNRRRAQRWRRVRVELEQLRREYEAAAGGGRCPEDHAMSVQVGGASTAPGVRLEYEDGERAERNSQAHARHLMTACGAGLQPRKDDEEHR